MARTIRQRVALSVVIAFATIGTSDLRISGLAQAELGTEPNGKKLFERETFGGNGRTCQTCHSKQTGTLDLADVQRIIEKGDPDRFLIHDALDGDGGGILRVQTHATIAVRIPLPPWVSLADEPGAIHVTVFRGIPSTMNTPALDPILNYDGRPPTVQEQARAAIDDHYQNTVEPTAAQLDAIAEFQQTNAHFFSSLRGSSRSRRFGASKTPRRTSTTTARRHSATPFAHYQRFFNSTAAEDPVGSASLGGFITLTDNDVDDIVAYLKLLGPAISPARLSDHVRATRIERSLRR